MNKFLLFIFLIIPAVSYCQLSADWYNYPGGISIATDNLNNSYTVNWDYNPGGDITLTKRDASGNLIWNAFYNNTDNTRHEAATWVETDLAGNILVTGTIRSGYSNPVNAASVLMKFSPTGTLLWRVVYENTFDGSSTKKCLVDGNNNVYVLGLGIGPNGMVTKIKKFSSSGTALWSYFDNAGIGAPVNFKFTPDNKILISARGITGSINGYAKIDLNGNQEWSIAGISSLTIGDAAGDASGNTYMVNGEYVVSNPGSVLRKISSTGLVLWADTNSITAYRVETGSDQNPVICGFPNSGSGGAAFIKYAANGTILWQNLDADGQGYALLLHAQLKMDAYDNIYLAAGTLSQMAVCKVNSNGTSAWLGLALGGYANAIKIGSDYNVYVTGGTTARFGQAVPCTTPSGLLNTKIQASQANFKWNQVPTALQYEIWYKKQAATKWSKRFVNGIYKSATIKNLACNKVYEWKIRAICDTAGPGIKSGFSSTVSFTTAACREAEIGPAENTDGLQVNPSIASETATLIYPVAATSVEASLDMVDLSGRLVFHEKFETTEAGVRELNMSGFSPGLYLVRLTINQNLYFARVIRP